jgi:hypothetical protein
MGVCLESFSQLLEIDRAGAGRNFRAVRPGHALDSLQPFKL